MYEGVKVMLKIVIVDDEREARERLRSVINQTMFHHKVDYQISEFACGNDLFRTDSSEIDIIFLDIEMQQENGIHISKQLQEQEKKPIIIFVTSYDGYLKHAFGLNVYAYIMKDEINEVVPRTLRSVLKELDKKTYLLLDSDQGPITMKYQDILYIWIDDRKLYVQTNKEHIRVYGTSLKKISIALNSTFLYPNSKYIINGRHIQSIENGAVILDNNACVFISKGKFKKFNEAYKAFLMNEVIG